MMPGAKQVSQEGGCSLWETTGKKKKATHSLSPEHIVEAGDTKEGRKLFQWKDNDGTITNMKIWVLNKHKL